MKCPQCNVPVFGSNIGFYDCYYNFYGKKIYNVEENKEEIHSIGKKSISLNILILMMMIMLLDIKKKKLNLLNLED